MTLVSAGAWILRACRDVFASAPDILRAIESADLEDASAWLHAQHDHFIRAPCRSRPYRGLLHVLRRGACLRDGSRSLDRGPSRSFLGRAARRREVFGLRLVSVLRLRVRATKGASVLTAPPRGWTAPQDGRVARVSRSKVTSAAVRIRACTRTTPPSRVFRPSHRVHRTCRRRACFGHCAGVRVDG